MARDRLRCVEGSDEDVSVKNKTKFARRFCSDCGFDVSPVM